MGKLKLLAVKDSRPFYESMGFRQVGELHGPHDSGDVMEMIIRTDHPRPTASGASQEPPAPFVFDDRGLVCSAFGHPSLSPGLRPAAWPFRPSQRRKALACDKFVLDPQTFGATFAASPMPTPMASPVISSASPPVLPGDGYGGSRRD